MQGPLSIRPCYMSNLVSGTSVTKLIRSSLVVSALFIFFALVVTGCGTVHPGGKSDFWTTDSYAKDDMYYVGVGITF